MNRRELISTVAVLPLIAYTGIKYKTPPQYEPFEKFVFSSWEEFPFDDIKVGDVVRKINSPEYKMKVTKLIPEIGPYNPKGFIVERVRF